MPTVKGVTALPLDERQEQALEVLPDRTVSTFERLAKDPNVTPEKLERLVALEERILARQAEAQFWEAFADMQGELPTIQEDGSIIVDGAVRSRYSTNENIQEVIRPILSKHGFALSHRNATTDKGYKVTAILAHRGGHKEFDEFESKPDDGGRMNSIQRIGSTRSYGARYTTIAILNIVSRAPIDRDDDGESSEAPEAPEGFNEWVLNLEASVSHGTKALMDVFNKADKTLRTFLVRNHKRSWEGLRARAAKAQA